MANIFQSEIMTNFLYPLLLMFVLIYAILEKINLFGKEGEKKQIHIIISLVISLIFVAAVFPKIIVANLIQFLTITLTIIFVSLMIWGFISGKGEFPEKMRTPLGILLGIALLFAVIWAAGLNSSLAVAFQNFFGFLFSSSWSASFWTNLVIILVVAGVIAIVLWKGAQNPVGKSS